MASLCAAGDDGNFCVPAGDEGEGEDESEPAASLRLEAGSLEGDEQLDVTLGWTLAAVTGCELRADGVDTGVSLSGQTSAMRVIEDSQTLQIVCNEAESEALVLVVHDVSEIEGPTAASTGATVTMTFSIEGVTTCTVTTDGAATSLTQPAIDGANGSFTDLADSDKSYTLTCAGIEGSIVRTFDLKVLTVDDVLVTGIVTHGDSLEVTASVDPEASCALVSTAPDGTDRRTEGSATVVVDGEARTFTLANVTAARSCLVECSIDDATAASAPAAVRIRPRIVSFDARIPNIETLDGAAATLELLVSVQGWEQGGSCVINDGSAELPYSGSNPVLTTGPAVATYTLRCSAPGSDAAPEVGAGFQVLWRNATEADLTLLAASRFAMRAVIIDNLSNSTIDLGSIEQMGDDVTIQAITPVSGGVAIPAPHLTDVAGSLVIKDIAALQALMLDQLRTVDQLWLDGLGGLSSFTAPEFVRGDVDFAGVWIWDCLDLVSVELPLYEGTGGFRIGYLPQLQQLTVPELAEANRFELTALPLLSEFAAPSLTTVRDALFLNDIEMEVLEFTALAHIGGGITLVGSASMRRFSVPVLTTTGDGGVLISINDSLRYLDTFVFLDTDPASEFTVTNNALLSCTEIGDLYCPLLTRDITPTISDNQTSSCPAANSGC